MVFAHLLKEFKPSFYDADNIYEFKWVDDCITIEVDLNLDWLGLTIK